MRDLWGAGNLSWAPGLGAMQNPTREAHDGVDGFAHGP